MRCNAIIRDMAKKTQPKRSQVTLTIPAEMLRRLRVIAEANGSTISGLVRVAVREKLSRDAKTEAA